MPEFNISMKMLNVNTALNRITEDSGWMKASKIEWHKEAPVRFKEIPVKLKEYNKCSLNIENNDDGPYNFDIYIKNNWGSEMGREELLFNFHDRYIFGSDMQVEEAYKQAYKVGETLRLASIMEMLINNLEKIKIFSTNSAVMFHAKYGFKPNITKFDERNHSLEILLKTKEPDTEALQKQAKELSDRLDQRNLDVNNPESVDLYKRCNEITCKFIQQILKNGKNVMPNKQPFNNGMDMVLTKEDIIINKNVYNQLYQNHEIDFQI